MGKKFATKKASNIRMFPFRTMSYFIVRRLLMKYHIHCIIQIMNTVCMLKRSAMHKCRTDLHQG